MVDNQVYLPMSLNCGLSAPWFFTKAMKPVVTALRRKGHRVFSYLDEFFGAARSSSEGPTSAPDTAALGREMYGLLYCLGLTLHPHKCDFSGQQNLEIVGIVVDTAQALFVLSAPKLAKIENQARRFLQYVSQHRRYVRVRDIRRFAGLGHLVSPAVVDARQAARAVQLRQDVPRVPVLQPQPPQHPRPPDTL